MAGANHIKMTVALGAFGPLVTRFVPVGYRSAVAGESSAQRVRRVVEELQGTIHGVELYHPYGIDLESRHEVRDALLDCDLYAIAIAHHPDPLFARGALCSPDARTRERALEHVRSGIDIAAEFRSHVIIWPGVEGFNYPFQTEYRESWARLIDGLVEAAERCRERGLQLLLEPKDSEPAMKLHMRDCSAALVIVQKLRLQGLNNVKVNMDWQNVILRGDSLAETASLLASEDALGHLHASAGWGRHDDKTIVGTSYFFETLELALVLRTLKYGEHGERLGLDLYPYTEDPAAAVRRSRRYWETINQLALRIDPEQLREAQATKDAVAAYDLVYDALGGAPDAGSS
jgi:xylose isomerase